MGKHDQLLLSHSPSASISTHHSFVMDTYTYGCISVCQTYQSKTSRIICAGTQELTPFWNTCCWHTQFHFSSLTFGYLLWWFWTRSLSLEPGIFNTFFQFNLKYLMKIKTIYYSRISEVYIFSVNRVVHLVIRIHLMQSKAIFLRTASRYVMNYKVNEPFHENDVVFISRNFGAREPQIKEK